MFSKICLVMFAAFLVNCGDKNRSEPKGGFSWSELEIANFEDPCVEGAVNSEYKKIDVGQAKIFCSCVRKAVESKYKAFDYEKLTYEVTWEMSKDGSLARCEELSRNSGWFNF